MNCRGDMNTYTFYAKYYDIYGSTNIEITLDQFIVLFHKYKTYDLDIDPNHTNNSIITIFIDEDDYIECNRKHV